MTEHGYEAEKEAIRKAILEYYSKGHDTCDPALYEEILHPRWRFMLFDAQEELMIVDRSEYCSWYNPNEAGKGFALPCSFPQSGKLPYSRESGGGNSRLCRELPCNAGQCPALPESPQGHVH